ncbi:MAG: S8 family serine peptidase [Actinomycetia bacterium]|nr:S8 family serine peptidase [Actinomycetes bacterium]
MRRALHRALAFAVSTALLFVLSAPAWASTSAHVGAHAPATGIIVAWEAGSATRVRTALSRRGLRVQRTLYGNRGAVVSIPNGVDAAALTTSLSAMPGVKIAAENRQVMRPLWTPNDPLFSAQWAYRHIQGASAWDVERGDAFVTVAIIDTGADLTHPELIPALDLTRDWDFVNDDDTADDVNGHGTHVAGIIAAASNNAIGVVGTAPGVKTVPIKVIGTAGGSNADFVEGLWYAADLGVDVINMSVGTTAGDLGAGGIALMQDAVDYAYSNGIVMVAAAGNDSSSDSYYPGACDHVISVSATDPTDMLAAYSNYGSAIDIAAPGGGAASGTGILSTYTIFGSHTYEYLFGTSMASPFVAAGAALLRSHVPTATPAEVETALFSSAKDMGEAGWDSKYGHGMLQMRDALDAILAPAPGVFRIQGADRYATAIAQSRFGFASDTVTTTVLVSGEEFADALVGSSLAGAYGSPLLLTRSGSLPGGLLAEIKRLGARKVVVIGGPAAVGLPVTDALVSAGLEVQPVWGPDRYATAAAAAEELQVVTGAASLPRTFLVRGDLYPDALAVSPFAAGNATPVLLTRPNVLPDASRASLQSIGATEVIIAGSTTAVGTAVASAVSALPGVDVTRWQGLDRYETAADVAREGIGRGWATGSYFGVATGANFPEGLAGGVLAARERGVVLLTNPLKLSASARGVVQELGHDGARVAIYGSTSAISKVVEGELMRIRY